jgi:NTE family protein
VKQIVFQVDLFSSRGVLPRDMSDVLGRHKDIIVFVARYNTDVYCRLHTRKTQLYAALYASRMPIERRKSAS